MSEFNRPTPRRWAFDLPMSKVMLSHPLWTDEHKRKGFVSVVIQELTPDLERDACKEMVPNSAISAFSMFAKHALVSIDGKSVALERSAWWFALGEQGRGAVIMMRSKATDPTEDEKEAAESEGKQMLSSFCVVV